MVIVMERNLFELLILKCFKLYMDIFYLFKEYFMLLNVVVIVNMVSVCGNCFECRYFEFCCFFNFISF